MTKVKNNSTIIVIGAAGKIGKALVDEFVESGSAVIAADISYEKLQTPFPKFVLNEKKVIYSQIDICELESILNLISCSNKIFGDIDAVVNVAYPRNNKYGAPVAEVTYGNFCENLNLHLGGYFLVLQQFCKLFQKQGYGSVINFSSIYGSMAPKFEIYDETNMTMPIEYAAIKAGVENISRYFAKLYKKDGVRVNTISPGGILADQPTKFKSAYEMHCGTQGLLASIDLFGTVEYLVSDSSKFMTGQNLIVDDGFSL